MKNQACLIPHRGRKLKTEIIEYCLGILYQACLIPYRGRKLFPAPPAQGWSYPIRPTSFSIGDGNAIPYVVVSSCARNQAYLIPHRGRKPRMNNTTTTTPEKLGLPHSPQGTETNKSPLCRNIRCLIRPTSFPIGDAILSIKKQHDFIFHVVFLFLAIIFKY